MFDNITATAEYTAPEDIVKGFNKPVVYNGYTYLPNRAPGNDMYVSNYSRDFGTFKIFLCRYNIVLKNSLHKLHHHTNTADFTLSEVVSVIHNLEEITGIKANNFTLNKLEVGVTIHVDESMDFIKSINTYKGNPFDNVRRITRLYGKKCFLNDYTIKFYSKTFEALTHQQIVLPADCIRIEVTYKRARAIPEIISLADLTNKSLVFAVINDFREKLMKVTTNSLHNFENCSEKEFILFFAGSNLEFWKCYKRYIKPQYEYLRECYRKALRKVQVESPYTRVVQKAILKLTSMANN